MTFQMEVCYPHAASTSNLCKPLYRLRTAAEDFEIELLNSSPLRRLKHLHHFGAGASISPITHSRYEHIFEPPYGFANELRITSIRVSERR